MCHRSKDLNFSLRVQLDNELLTLSIWSFLSRLALDRQLNSPTKGFLFTSGQSGFFFVCYPLSCVNCSIGVLGSLMFWPVPLRCLLGR